MPNAHGQERGNSGVGLHGRYEIQILDSYGIADPGSGDCGAVYGQAAPLSNACKPPLQWQSYDIAFRAARLDAAGKVVENPRVTVFQNGIPVQNNQEIKRMTGIQYSQYTEMGKSGPILLQEAVPILEGDTVETLRRRVHEAEYRILPKAIRMMEAELANGPTVR